jgi:hypothetical protein
MPHYPTGRRLVEVFSVRIDNIDKEGPDELYGTIKAIDGLGTQDLFNRISSDNCSSDYQSVNPGEDVELTGSRRPISSADAFLIKLSLYDHDDLSPDNEISKGQISWNPYNSTNEFNKLRKHQISGKHGAATINYIVLNDASDASIQFVLISGDGENPANVYGFITAFNGFGDSQLFKRSSDKYVNVYPDGAIPLLRTSMAVPRTKELVIHADLKDHDYEIVKGPVIFEPLIHKSA